MSKIESLKKERFLRLKQVLELFPVSKSTWYAGIEKGIFPHPIRICSRISVWRASDIFQMMEEMANA